MTEKSVGYRSPLYLQLREVIRGKIESGEYPPGTCIPSESALSKIYGIHRLSVRSAISALEYEGLLRSVQGKGVFVIGGKDERDLETIGGFKQTMQMLGRTPSTKVITKALRLAGPCYAQSLGVEAEALVNYIKRVCYSDGDAYSLEEIYIPQSVIPTLPDIDLGLFSIYEIYEFYGIQVTRVDQSLEVTQLDPIEARLLDIDPSSPVLKFQSVSCDQKGRIIEYARTYTRGDRCSFNVHYSEDRNSKRV